MLTKMFASLSARARALLAGLAMTLGLAITAQPAYAISGMQLLSVAANSHNQMGKALVLGYIIGSAESTEGRHCAPRMPADDLANLIVDKLGKLHEKELQGVPAHKLIAEILAEQFPCPNNT